MTTTLVGKRDFRLDDLVDTAIKYGLGRVYNPGSKEFDYVLRARLPKDNKMVSIMLDKELGRILGSYWTQNEHGTFLGIHNMEWVIKHLAKGEDI
jgi:hypothetical protein